jgi:hypothetical protein
VAEIRDAKRSAEERAALAEAESKRLKEDIEFQDAEVGTLRQTVAQQVDELV